MSHGLNGVSPIGVWPAMRSKRHDRYGTSLPVDQYPSTVNRCSYWSLRTDEGLTWLSATDPLRAIRLCHQTTPAVDKLGR